MACPQMKNVTAGIIQHEGRILICQRPAGKDLAYLWEFPGGKTEGNESLEDCLRRELKEELDISIHDIEPLAEIEKPEAGLRIRFFTCRLDPDQEPVRLEHAALAWVNEQELSKYRFCPGDQLLLRFIPASILFGSDTSQTEA